MRERPALAAFAGIFVVTMLGLLAVGATLPVLPRYVKGPIGSTDLAVGVVSGAFAFTGLAFRPLAGHIADARGRRITVVIGALLSALAGILYFVPAGVPGLIVARLFLGAGEGMVFTAGSAWVVDLAPPERRGRLIGLYGLSIWSGLSLGPPIGELLLRASSFEVVWAFAAGAPLAGALIATRIPERFEARARERGRSPLLAREAIRPGLALSLGVVGFAAVAAFLVLHLEARGIGHGAETFTAFAATVVLTRLIGGDLPDRLGPVPCAFGAAVLEAVGLALIGLAESAPVAIAGAMVIGGAYSALYPALALLVVERVPEERRGVALGTFTACFDLGVGLGSPLVGAFVVLGGYGAAFFGAAACALGAAAIAALALPRLSASPAPLPDSASPG